jgi:hypothetical protein
MGASREHMNLLAASSAVLGTVAFVLVACSSAPPPSASSNSDVTKNDKSSSGAPSNAAASASPAPAKAAPAPNTAQCAATANHEDCSNCCEGKDGASVKVEMTASDQCVCNSAKAKCSAECATGYCNMNSDGSSDMAVTGSDDPCASCQPDFDACDAQAKKACDADPTCAAAEKCYADAKCDAKPAGPDEDTVSATADDGSGN